MWVSILADAIFAVDVDNDNDFASAPLSSYATQFLFLDIVFAWKQLHKFCDRTALLNTCIRNKTLHRNFEDMLGLVAKLSCRDFYFRSMSVQRLEIRLFGLLVILKNYISSDNYNSLSLRREL